MRFIARTPVRYSEGEGETRVVKTIAPGRPVPEQFVDDDLIATGAVEEVVADDPDDELEPSPAGKPLNKQTKPELLATAAAEGADVPEGATNLQIIAAIEAKRAGTEG